MAARFSKYRTIFQKISERLSIYWRNILLMGCVLLVTILALLIYHRAALVSLGNAERAQLQSDLNQAGEKMSNDLYMPYAIPAAISGTKYYEYIRTLHSGYLPLKYYSTFAFLKDDFANQVYLRSSSVDSLLYFPGCNSICTTGHIYPVAEDCLEKMIRFEQISTADMIELFRTQRGVTVLPMQQVTINDTPYEALTVIIRPNERPITVCSIYAKETILDYLGITGMPDSQIYLQICSNNGQVLFEYPQTNSNRLLERGYEFTTPLSLLRCTVHLWVAPEYFSEKVAVARDMGLSIILFAGFIGILLVAGLSRISVWPLRRLTAQYSTAETPRSKNELVYLDHVLYSAKEKLNRQRQRMLDNMFLLALSGAVLSAEDERLLGQCLLPNGGVYRIAVLRGRTEALELVEPRLAEAYPDIRREILHASEISIFLSGDSRDLELLTSFVDQYNASAEEDADKVKCGISHPEKELENLYTAVQQARMAIPSEYSYSLYNNTAIWEYTSLRLQYERLYAKTLVAEEVEDVYAILNNIAKVLNPGNEREIFYNVRFFLRNAAEEMGVPNLGTIVPAYNRAKLARENYASLYEFARVIIVHRKESEQAMADNQANKILRFVRENASNYEMCAQMVADHFSTRERYIYSLVRAETGMSFNEYLTDLRMKRAGELLYSTTLVVTEVAKQCGYQVESTFYRLFKKYYGMSPRQYRGGPEDSEERAK